MKNNISFAYNITQIQNYTASHIKSVNDIILKCCHESGDLIWQIGEFIVSSGGKRVRPILLYLYFQTVYKTLLSKNLKQNQNAKIIQYNVEVSSSVIELIHTASLLHDDIIDEATKRRGKKTANSIWGNKEVILVGDFLFAKSFDLISQIKSYNIVDVLSKACVNLTRGEVNQLQIRTKQTTLQEYYDIIYCKTASLFEASTKIAAILAVECFDFNDFETNSIDINSIIQDSITVGKNIGIAFQIVDDILDYSTSNKAFGKESGRDFLEGKTTLPIILAKQQSSVVRDIFETRSFSLDNFNITLEIIKQNKILEQSKQIADGFTKECLSVLNKYHKSDDKDYFLNLINCFCNRDF